MKKKTMTMGQAFSRAIRLFEKTHKIGNAFDEKGAYELRTVQIYECSGAGKSIDYALVHIEYVSEWGRYHEMDYRVFANGRIEASDEEDSSYEVYVNYELV